jgi:hypothetical protein
MPERTLSSDWTYTMKFIFPVVWILVFGLGGVVLWSKAAEGTAAPPLGFIAAWIAGTAFILWANVGLKRIRADDRQLHVSNYFREVSVPFSAIADVKQNRWLSTKPITIHFKEATGFGDKVTFMPKQRFAFWSEDPTVGELRKLAGLTN